MTRRAVYFVSKTADRDRTGQLLDTAAADLSVSTERSVEACIRRIEREEIDCLVGTDPERLTTVYRDVSPIPVVLLVERDEPIPRLDVPADDAVVVTHDDADSTAERIVDATDRSGRGRSANDPGRLAALFENVHDPIVRYGYEDGLTIVRAVNPAFESVFGFDGERIRGEPVGDLIVPPESLDEAKRLAERAADGDSLDTEIERLAADGRRHFLLRNVPIGEGATTEGFGIYTDITEQKRHEQAVERLHTATRELLQADDAEAIAKIATETSRTVLEFPHSGVFLWNESSELLEPVEVPTAGRTRIGEPPTFECGEGIAGTAFDADEPIIVDDAQADERASGDSDGRIRSYCVIPLGEHGVLTIASPEIGRFDENDVELASILAANATVALDRTESEQALRERERELERQNERLDEFASVVSHDLRNPINVAGGRLELAIEELDNEHVEIARDAVDRMDALVENVLRLARQGRNVGAPDWVRLDRLCERSWATVTADATDATVRTETIDGLAVEADPDRLRQALENLFSNAIEHGGSDVTVEVGPLADGFYVADDGPGVPPEEREELFAFGESSDEDGTGIGLAIVRSIVRAHGWTIDVTESEYGGTRFEIRGVEIGER